jgi:hypothetical protein
MGQGQHYLVDALVDYTTATTGAATMLETIDVP